MSNFVYNLASYNCPFFLQGACIRVSPQARCNLQLQSVSLSLENAADYECLVKLAPQLPGLSTRVTTCGGFVEIVKRLIEQNHKELIAVFLTSDSELIRKITWFQLKTQRENNVEVSTSN